MALCRYLKMTIFKHDCWNEMVILNNKSPFVALMKTVEVLFLVKVFISTFAINRLHFFILKFLLLKLANYEITLMINIILIFYLQSMVQYCYCLYILNSKALVLCQYPFINYRSINRYWPVLSNSVVYFVFVYTKYKKREHKCGKCTVYIMYIWIHTHTVYILKIFTCLYSYNLYYI